MAARHRQRWQRRALVFDAMVPWIPMLVGIAIMAGYVIYAVVLSVGDRSESTLSPPDPSAFHHTPAPLLPPSIRVPTPGGGESEVVIEPARGTPPRVSPPPPPPPPSPAPPPAPPPADPAPPALEGKYRLDGLYRHAFIGKVVISNPAGEAQDWVVELEFPDDVGRLNTFWVDGTPQPTKERSGDRYVFTSTVPVEGNSTVVLKFHFDFFGRDITPTLCTVNGNACDI